MSGERLRETLMAAKGYMLNAKIDLETGAPKRTAIQTLEGGLRRIDAGFVASYSDYAAGFRAGIEAAAQIIDEEAGYFYRAGNYRVGKFSETHGSQSTAARIRDLKPDDAA